MPHPLRFESKKGRICVAWVWKGEGTEKLVNGKQHSVWLVPTRMKGLPQNMLLNFQLEYKHQLIQPYHLSSIRNFRNFLSNGKHPSSLKGLWREAPNRRFDQSEREFVAYSQWYKSWILYQSGKKAQNMTMTQFICSVVFNRQWMLRLLHYSLEFA